MKGTLTHYDSELAADVLELAIVVPTFNEIENIDALVSAPGRFGWAPL